MKPCTEYRESIALLAARALDPAARENAERHLESCRTCRDHFENLQRVCGQLDRLPREAVSASPELPANFHRRLLERIRADVATPRPSPASFFLWFQAWFSWPRVASMGAIAAVLVTALLLMDPNRVSQDPRAKLPGALPVTGQSTPAPTLMALSRALQESEGALDSLLTRQEQLLAANDPPSVALGGNGVW